jgi:hypothetical protein
VRIVLFKTKMLADTRQKLKTGAVSRLQRSIFKARRVFRPTIDRLTIRSPFT